MLALEPSYIERIDFMDHHNFKEKDLLRIERRAEQMEADYILTTEKDFVKFPKHLNIPNLYVLKIEFTMLEDHSLKTWRII